MAHEQLWAPWRFAYVTKDAPAKSEGCFICHGVAANEDRKHLIVLRTARSVVLLNKYPYNNGHLLVAPLTHKGRLDELTTEELLDGQEMIRRFIGILEKRMNPDGFNIGLNLGTAAGAGLPGHLHWHIVPRWNGDTNYMAVMADVRVIVQSLDSLFELLEEELKLAPLPGTA